MVKIFLIFLSLKLTVIPILCLENDMLYKHIQVTTFNSRNRAMLYKIHKKQPQVIMLNLVTNEAALPVDVLVAQPRLAKFEMKLQEYDIQYSYGLSYNMSDLIDPATAYKSQDYMEVSNRFLTYDAIEQWVDEFTAKYPHAMKTKISETANGLNVTMLKISTGKRNYAAMIVAGEDGKDWLTVAVFLNYLNNFLSDKNQSRILDHMNLYVVPLVNPDGYNKSMEEDRFWSRNLYTFYPKTKCKDGTFAQGVNIDRNWPLYHNKVEEHAESCDAVHFGTEPLSEKETHGLEAMFLKYTNHLMAFIKLKGFGRMITVPFAGVPYKPRDTANNHDLMMEILSYVHQLVEKIHNVSYYYGTTSRFLYNYMSNIADYAKCALNIPVVLTIHLKPLDESELFGTPADFKDLTAQLATILDETLSLASDIYKPLFSSQIKNTFDVVTLCLTLVLLLLV